MSKTFVLIHGSWHGGWAWQDVIHQLSREGHSAHAPTLAGHGPGATRLGITHQDCVDSVVECIHHYKLEDVVLVGHSFGGTIVQRVAEKVHDRIARMVFLDALIVEDGHCVFDELPADYVTLFSMLAGASPDNSMLIPWEIWRDNFIQDASESVARSLWEQLSPEPNQVNLAKLCLRLCLRDLKNWPTRSLKQALTDGLSLLLDSPPVRNRPGLTACGILLQDVHAKLPGRVHERGQTQDGL